MAFFVLLGVILLWWLFTKVGARTESSKLHAQVPSKAPSDGDLFAALPISRTGQRCKVIVQVDRCHICRSKRPPRFRSRRAIFCQYCVGRVNDHYGTPVAVLHEIVEDSLRRYRCAPRSEEAPECPMERVLNGGLLKAEITFELRYPFVFYSLPQVSLRQIASLKGFWLNYLRAYHLGLISSDWREERPVPIDWKQLRLRIRSEDGDQCLICHKRHTRLDVHHIIHLSKGGTNDPANLITLCYLCHRRQHPDIHFSLPAP